MSYRCHYDGKCIHEHNDILTVLSVDVIKKKLPLIIKKECHFRDLGYDRSIIIMK